MEQTIQLLEFTRTGDLWEGSLTTAKDKKTEKYERLREQLALLYPMWSVSVIPFVMGSRSSLDEGHWGASWFAILLLPPASKKLIPRAQAWNVEAAREMPARNLRSNVPQAEPLENEEEGSFRPPTMNLVRPFQNQKHRPPYASPHQNNQLAEIAALADGGGDGEGDDGHRGEQFHLAL